MLRIKELIKQKGMTSEEVSEKLDMNKVSFSRIINGNPTIQTLEKIAKVLDVDISELFETSVSVNKDTIYVRRNDKYVSIGQINMLID